MESRPDPEYERFLEVWRSDLQRALKTWYGVTAAFAAMMIVDGLGPQYLLPVAGVSPLGVSVNLSLVLLAVIGLLTSARTAAWLSRVIRPGIPAGLYGLLGVLMYLASFAVVWVATAWTR